MRNKIKISFGILLFLTLISSVMAQEIEVNPGITPNNRLFYGLDRAVERIRIAFTFREESKVNYELKLAEERISEMKAMKNISNFVALENARIGYENSINRIGDKNISEESRLRLRTQLQTQLKNLNNILDDIPIQERTKLKETIENSIKVRRRFG